jgi:DNA-binding CsgD family transcriptional regulator
VALVAAARVDEAVVAAQRAVTAAVEHGGTRWLLAAELVLGRVCVLAGRPVTALSWLRDVASSGVALGHGRFRAEGLAGVVAAAAAAGDAGAVRAALDDLGPPPPDGGPASAQLGVALALAEPGGELRAGHRGLRRAALAAEGRGARVDAAAAWFVIACAAPCAAAVTEAAERLDAIAEHGDSPLVRLFAAHAGAVRRRDAEALAAATDAWTRAGALRPARAAAVAAVAAATANGRGRRATALAARAAAVAAACPEVRGPSVELDAAPEPLTAREREIAALAAAGASSRDIAARLVVSVRTVDNHLRSVYLKLGVSGRGELRAALRG